jgi:hypothetical protein
LEIIIIQLVFSLTIVVASLLQPFFFALAAVVIAACGGWPRLELL